MTWRQLFNRRPKWWIALAARLRSMTDSDADSDAPDRATPGAPRNGRGSGRSFAPASTKPISECSRTARSSFPVPRTATRSKPRPGAY